MARRLAHLLPAVLWAALIFWLSSMTTLESPLSQGWDFLLRKFAHAAEYAILALLLFRGLPASSRTIKTVIAFGLAVLYAGSDEIHQAFVPGRFGNGTDVLIDSWGALIALSFVLAWGGEKRNRPR